MVHFAAVRDDGKSLELFFLPEDCYFTDQAAKVNGLTVEELQKKGATPFSKEDAEMIAEFMPGRGDDDKPVPIEAIGISHNYDEDRRILLKHFKAIKVYLPKWTDFCTMKFARRLQVGQDSKFSSLCAHYGVTNENAHNALSDAKALM